MSRTSVSGAAGTVNAARSDTPKVSPVTEIWQPIRHLPAYLRLAGRLLKEPAVPLRHKLPLGACAVYEVSPAHLAIAAVPVLGQIDSVILFLAALHLALAHCPHEKAVRHLAELDLTERQMEEDMETVLRIPSRMTKSAGRTAVRLVSRAARGLAVTVVSLYLEGVEQRDHWTKGLARG